jgi:hypothetical protein
MPPAPVRFDELRGEIGIAESQAPGITRSLETISILLRGL